MKTDFSKLVFNGIALAMGVAVIVANIAHAISLSSATTALAIGLFALGLAGLKK
jgi:hypothetical protein